MSSPQTKKKGRGELILMSLSVEAVAEERYRLHLQHRLLKRAFENRLILAPIALKDGDAVLECGTGSGTSRSLLLWNVG